MLRKLIALSVAASSLFAAARARADWLMIGAYDFQPYDKTTQYTFSGGRGGYVASGFSAVKAPVRIPIGKTFTSLWCQVLDVSSTSNISLSLGELTSTDDSSDWSERTIMSMSTTGSPGFVKISTGTISGSALVKTFTCGSVCTYYTYYLTVSLPGNSSTNIKSCALEYQ
jgi:hypothetical protein